MKKFLIACAILIAAYLSFDYIYNVSGFYLFKKDETTTVMHVEGKDMFITDENGEHTLFEMKGVDIGLGIPAHFATDYAIDKETYLRWFELIQEMGANCIRVYTILQADFYEAVYEYNIDNENPLYVVHGIWVDDYIHNASVDAFDETFIDPFIQESLDLVDVLHGRKKFYFDDEHGYESYKWDISPWVVGYITGVEWETSIVSFTNHFSEDKAQFSGNYLYTGEDAAPFEAFLTQSADALMTYEAEKYGQQKMIAFSNWPTTDPFEYEEKIATQFSKTAVIDVENIYPTDLNKSGMFASYHIYAYFPDFLNYEDGVEEYVDETGEVNTYYTYLKRINDYHTIPVVISEFGIPSSRGMARQDANGNRSQGFMSEQEQAEGIVESYNDIKAAGCSGAILFSWQDEWFKRTWNTMNAVDLTKTPYWSDYQTNEQFFGILAFDPGETESICYIDGDLSEWTQDDIVYESETASISAKYDQRFLYLLASTEDFAQTQQLYVSLDTTPNSGATYSENYDINFDGGTDFIIAIDGEDNSRIVVQERYEILRAMYGELVYGIEPFEEIPAVDSTLFKPILLRMQTAKNLVDAQDEVDGERRVETYETGLLIYANSNPKAEDFNSLGDIYFNENYVEIRIPWQLINFSNPSQMQIHDDYYEHFGVENLTIGSIDIGVGNGDETIEFTNFNLTPWKNIFDYHERLKESYYAVQEIWSEEK